MRTCLGDGAGGIQAAASAHAREQGHQLRAVDQVDEDVVNAHQLRDVKVGVEVQVNSAVASDGISVCPPLLHGQLSSAPRRLGAA